MKVFGIDIGLLLKLKKAKDAMDKDTKAGYDPKAGIIKGFKDMGESLGVAFLGLVAALLSDPVAFGKFFSDSEVNPLYIGVLFMVGKGVVTFITNWTKNRNNTVVMMVPVEAPKPNDRRGTPTLVAGAAPVAITMKPAEPPATVPTIPATDTGA